MSNSARRESKADARMARRQAYITDLHYFATQFEDSCPLLHRVTIQSGSDDSSPIPNMFAYGWSRSIGDEDPSRRDTLCPFPSLAELIEMPTIKNLLAKDVGVGQFDDILQDCQDQVELEIHEWELNVEQELVNILNSGQNNPTDNLSLASKLTNSKAILIPSPIRYLNIRPPGSLDDTTIPKSTITFHKPGSLGSTTDTSVLRPATQTLLRADARFIRNNLSMSYPMVCSPHGAKPRFSAKDSSSYGARWNQDPISFDEQGSMICRRLLAELGRPDAMHAELSIIGNNFKCGRCSFPPTIWEVMVGHYREESNRWEQVQSTQKKSPSLIPYNNLRDLASNEHKPLVYMVSPKVAHETLKLNYGLRVDRRFCDLCRQLGLDPHSYRLVTGDDECALLQHLRDV
ncbi:hypothetical protein FRC07_005595 [Ceratobasidium sp. 392]|nr:hypothetical protein FRC07_005595 [Ceratobasidium sp. 392]